MESFNEEEIRDFYSLNNNMQFKSFKSWISRSLLAQRVASDRLNEFGEMKVSQGYRQALDDILDNLENLESEFKDSQTK